MSTSHWLETEIGDSVKINAGQPSQDHEIESMALAFGADKPRYLN